MTDLRSILGAVGLLLVGIAGPIAILVLLIDPSALPTLLVLSGVGLLLWGQAVAAQARLGFRVTIAWLITLAGLVAAIIVALSLVYAAASAVFGDSSATKLVAGAFVAFATSVVGVWAIMNPRRDATLRALYRAALGRATPEDSRLLAAGPLTLLRPEATPPMDPSGGPTDRA